MGSAARGQRVRRPGSRPASPSGDTGSWWRPRPPRGPRCASRAARSGPPASGPRRCSTAPGRGRRPAATADRRCWRWARAWRCRVARPRARRRCRSTSAAPLEELLGGVELDIVHVHDPFAPSAASVALRHSRSLNVGSFHEPSERILSTQVARPLVEIFFGRLDARTVSCRTTSDADGALLSRHLRAGRAGGRPWGGGLVAAAPGRRHGPGSGSRAARADRVLPSGGARRAAALPASAPPPAARTSPGRRRSGSPAGDEIRIARRLRDRVHAVGPREIVARGADRGGRRRLRRLGRPPAGSRPGPQGARLRDGPGRLPALPVRGADPATASAACCSRPGTRSPWRASSSD